MTIAAPGQRCVRTASRRRSTVTTLVELGRARPHAAVPAPCSSRSASTSQGAPVDQAELEAAARRRAPATLPQPTRGGRSTTLRTSARSGAAPGAAARRRSVARDACASCCPRCARTGIPVMTTWNGLDRVGAGRAAATSGRPNTWGQRSANMLLQQADLVVALGTRLGLQQTGFNWQEFVPRGHRRAGRHRLAPSSHKGHPRVDLPLRGRRQRRARRPRSSGEPRRRRRSGCAFGRRVRELLPLVRPGQHSTGRGLRRARSSSCSRCRELMTRRRRRSSRARAAARTPCRCRPSSRSWARSSSPTRASPSMGYGLSRRDRRGARAPGAPHGPDRGRRRLRAEPAGARRRSRVNDLNLKIFIFANEGYASIRTTQRNYFGGAYLGCDTSTGLGFPDWRAAVRRVPASRR